MTHFKTAPKARPLGMRDLFVCFFFSTLSQGLISLFQLAGGHFPLIHVILCFTTAFGFSACVALVAKRWASMVFTVGWVAIQIFFRGAHPVYWVCIILLPALPELFFMRNSQWCAHPDQVFRQLRFAAFPVFCYSFLLFWWNFFVTYTVYDIAVSWQSLLTAFSLSIPALITGLVPGHALGRRLGRRIIQ